MILVRKLVILAVGSVSIQPCFAADPIIVQTDIVFPRNNTVYKPVYPFPIVFALNHFADVWQYKPVLNWRLLVWQRYGDWTRSEEGSMGWTVKTPNQIAPGP
jgi:hypothetical protein